MQSQNIVLAADHAGYPLKEAIKKYLSDKGMTVIDVGTNSEEPVDYPAIMRAGCALVLQQKMPGIIFGGSGNGEAMAANKVRGIRAAVCVTEEMAKLARSHNDANVLSLGARLIDFKTAIAIVDIFLKTAFEGGRHVARIADLDTPIPA